MCHCSWAVKEATFKAFGCYRIQFPEVYLSYEQHGSLHVPGEFASRMRSISGFKPVLCFAGNTACLVKELRIVRSHVSISHDSGVAIAQVILEQEVIEWAQPNPVVVLRILYQQFNEEETQNYSTTRAGGQIDSGGLGFSVCRGTGSRGSSAAATDRPSSCITLNVPAAWNWAQSEFFLYQCTQTADVIGY